MNEAVLPTTDAGIVKDNRILRATRILAAIIVPFLLVAFYILFLHTSETGTLFAWEISAPMTAMMLSAAYLGGAYFFTRAVFTPRWNRIAVGFLPVTTFASFLCIATLIHWDRFSQGHISFYAWFILYFTTPLLVFFTWLRNRRTDGGVPEARDFAIPRRIRLAIAAFGAFYVIIAVLLMLNPGGMIDFWPWPLTPLTARVVSAMLAMLGVFGLTIAADGRWSTCRIPLQSLMVALLLGLVAVWRAWDTFDPTRWFTWIFLATLIGLLILIPVAYALIERGFQKAR